jgi:hypothetical protein
MNKLKYLFGLVSLMFVSACTDFVDPAIPYSGFETGTYLRTLKSPAANFNYFDLSTAIFSIQVEPVDEQGGTTVRDVEVYVAHRRGPVVTPEKLVKTIPASEFKPNPDRNFPDAPNRNFPAATITVTTQEYLNALGLTIANLNGGDFFEYRLVLHTTTGKTFTNTNLSPDISGGAFYRSPFFYRVQLVCPSTLAGEYNLKTTGWCGTEYNGKVKFVAGAASGQYIIQVDLDGAFVEDFSFGFYRACYGASTAPPGGANGLRLTDGCGQIAFNASTSSPWGDGFKINDVQVAGPVLTLGVESTYPPEAGVAVITRTDGTNWPALRK